MRWRIRSSLLPRAFATALASASLVTAACVPVDSAEGTAYKQQAFQDLQVDEGWGDPTLLPPPVNTDGWEDGAYITPDGSQLYFAYFQGDLINFVGSGLKHFERYQRGPARGDRPGFLDVLVSQRQGEGWSEPARFRYAEDFFAEGGVMISTDGSLDGLWYNTNREPPHQHTDIYVNGIKLPPPVNTPERAEDPHFINGELFFWRESPDRDREIWMVRNIGGNPQTWEAPIRLTEPVNSATSDMQPFLTAEGLLYFASGQKSGNLGIHVSRRLGPNEWSEPQLVISAPMGHRHLRAVGEPTLTRDGRFLYFVVVFEQDGVLDCDIAKVTKTSASGTQTSSPIITQTTATNTAQQQTAEKPGTTLVKNILQGALQGAIDGAVKGLTKTPTPSTPSASTATMSTKTAGTTAGHSSIAPETWAGTGSTTSVTVATNVEGAQDGRATLWAYTFNTNPIPLLYTPPGSQARPEHPGIGVRLRSEAATTVALVAKESSGAQYEWRLELTPWIWISREARWNAFKLQDNNRDPNGHLDPAQIVQLLFVDIGGFMGKKGSNQLWLDEVWLQ